MVQAAELFAKHAMRDIQRNLNLSKKGYGHVENNVGCWVWAGARCLSAS